MSGIATRLYQGEAGLKLLKKAVDATKNDYAHHAWGNGSVLMEAWGVGALGDLAYVGIAEWHPGGLGATPRRKPRGRPRPEEDRRFNRAFARRRIVVEHTIGRLRRYQALSQVDRHRRRGHTSRVRAVAGLVNRMLDHRTAA